MLLTNSQMISYGRKIHEPAQSDEDAHNLYIKLVYHLI
jgi:hypothetical protein